MNQALHAAAQKGLAGRSENVAGAEAAFARRARMNGTAAVGERRPDLEQA
ncbi:MAG TPA: hypothetical protein VIL69_22855 [Roseomonas sp.]|jgi:fructose-bisphosphate aldolase class I